MLPMISKIWLAGTGQIALGHQYIAESSVAHRQVTLVAGMTGVGGGEALGNRKIVLR